MSTRSARARGLSCQRLPMTRTDLPRPRAATAAAAAAAEAGNGEGDGADGTADDEEDPGAPSPFRSILGSWHHLGQERR